MEKTKSKNKTFDVERETRGGDEVREKRGEDEVREKRGVIGGTKEAVVVLERLSDTDSVSTMLSVGSRASSRESLTEANVRGKRPLSSAERSRSDIDLSESDSGGSVPDTMTPTKKLKRGRGRPPTTGQYVGLAEAKRQFLKAEREEMELLAEKEVAEMVAERRRNSLPGLSSGALSFEGTEKELPALQFKAMGDEGLGLIQAVRKKSHNIKGTFVRAMKEGEEKLETCFRGMLSLQADTLRLEAEIARLQKENAEMANLRDENARLRAEMAALVAARAAPNNLEELPSVTAQSDPRPAPGGSLPVTMEDLRKLMDEYSKSTMERVSNMLGARIEGIEDRLLPAKRLRPPLAADRKKEAAVVTSALATNNTADSVAESAPPVTLPATSTANKKNRRKAKQAGLDQPVTIISTTTDSSAQQPTPAPLEEGWNVVARKKPKKMAPSAPLPRQVPQLAQRPGARQKPPPASAPKPKPKPTARPNLQPPNTAAVVITLQHEAVERGMTYKEAITKARQEFDPTSIGIPVGLKVRVAVTGGRVIELPEGVTSEKADLFAEKLRGVLAGIARVARPVKCAELRITGLDDSITQAEILTAVTTVGKCSPDHVRVGTIRNGPGGSGMVWVQCPVAAAKVLDSNGKLLIGWISARVEAMLPRPMKCFRCLELGHTRQQCTAETDRSELCFRCGKAGHKAPECSAKPHCVVCAAAGRPAAHSVGGRACAPSTSKKRRGQNNVRKGDTMAGKTPAMTPMGQTESRQEEMLVDHNG